MFLHHSIQFKPTGILFPDDYSKCLTHVLSQYNMSNKQHFKEIG